MPINPNSNHSLIVTVPKETTFKLNPGRYAAQIKSVRRIDRQTAQRSTAWIRILFTVNVPGLERFDCLAKLDFPLNLENGTDLRNLINRLLGKPYLASLSSLRFNFKVLKGLECEIELDHVECEGSENFDFPLVVVRDVQVPGSMNLKRTMNITDSGNNIDE